MKKIIDKVCSDGSSELIKLLNDYSSGRVNAQNIRVGQFCDVEGIKKKQHGLYGTAMFLTMSVNYSLNNYTTTNQIMDTCKDWIKDVVKSCQELSVEKYHTYLNEKGGQDYNDRENIYEACNVVPKISYLFEACYNSNLEKEKNILKKYIISAQKPDNGAFGYLCTDQTKSAEKSSLIVSCMVIRNCFLNNQEFDKEFVEKTIKYVESKIKSTNNIFHKLYALCTLQNLKGSKYVVKDQVAEIRSTLALFFSNIKKTYLFSNPINLDYNDEFSGRTRYFRIYSDLILLESLTLAHKNNLYFLETPSGQYFLNRVNKVLEEKVVDTTHHRISFSYCHALFHLINLMKSRHNSESNLGDKISSWYSRFKFMNYNVFEIAILLIMLIVAIIFSSLIFSPSISEKQAPFIGISAGFVFFLIGLYSAIRRKK